MIFRYEPKHKHARGQSYRWMLIISTDDMENIAIYLMDSLQFK